MALSSGRPQRLSLYQAGRGQEPVVVAAKGRFLVAVNAMIYSSPGLKSKFTLCSSQPLEPFQQATGCLWVRLFARPAPSAKSKYDARRDPYGETLSLTIFKHETNFCRRNPWCILGW